MRRAVVKHIEEEPTAAVVYRWPTTDNGYGKQVADLSEDPVEHIERVRISHVRAEDGIFAYEPNNIGVLPPTGLYVKARYNADIAEGDKIQRELQQYTVGAIDEIRRYGSVIAKRAAITKVETIEVST